MKKLLWLAFLLPMYANAQNTNGTLQRQIASPNAITGVFGSVRDSIYTRAQTRTLIASSIPALSVGTISSGGYANGLNYSSGQFRLGKVGPSNPGVLTTGPDTIAGNKNFTGNITAANIVSGSLQLSNPLPVTSGGTGLGAVGTSLQVLRTNSSATALEYGTLTIPTSADYWTTSTTQSGLTGSKTTSGTIQAGRLQSDTTATFSYTGLNGSLPYSATNNSTFGKRQFIRINALTGANGFLEFGASPSGIGNTYFGAVNASGGGNVADFVWNSANSSASAYAETMRLTNAGKLLVNSNGTDGTPGLWIRNTGSNNTALSVENSTNNTAFDVNQTGSGDLMAVSKNSLVKLYVNNAGNTTIGGTATISSLTNGLVKSTSGVLSNASSGDLSGAGIVLTTTNQTVAGVKTFTDSLLTSSRIRMVNGQLLYWGASGNASVTGATNQVSIATGGTDRAVITNSGLSLTNSGQFLSNTAATTSSKSIAIDNTTGALRLGVESSAGGSIFGTGTAYETVLGTSGNTNVGIFQNGTRAATFSPTGLALTGALTGTSATFSGALEVTNSFVNFTRGGKLLQLNPNYSNLNTTAEIDVTSGMGFRIAIGGTPRYTIDAGGNNTWTGTGTYAGDVSAPSFTISSDTTLKTNITRLSPVSNSLRNISSINYTLKSSGDDLMGFKAQDVKTYFPRLVKTDSNGKLGVNYSGFVSVLKQGWSEHDERITALEKENKELREEIANIYKLLNK